MKLFSWLFYLFLFACLLLSSVIFFAIEKKSLVTDSENLTTQTATASRELLSKSAKAIVMSNKPIELKASADELNGLVALASRAINNLHGRVNISSAGLIGAFSYQLPFKNIRSYFINIEFFLNPSLTGLDIDSVKIGGIKISGTLFTNIMVLTLDYLLQEKQGTIFLKSIKAITLASNQINIVFHPPQNLNSQLTKTKSRLKQYRDEMKLLGDPLKVRFYYQFLINLNKTNQKNGYKSFSYYLIPLFKEASQKSSNKFNAATENKTALLALAIYLGNPKFELLIGDVRTEKMKQSPPPRNITLAHRNDLRLHFIYSVFIKLASEQGISAAIGEFKEFLDSSKGGSGFSFDDLAADMAGVRLAEMATDNNSALKLQKLFTSQTSETSFFPEIRDLPSGLSQNEFELRFGSVEDKRYKKMVEKINQRLNKLELYKEG